LGGFAAVAFNMNVVSGETQGFDCYVYLDIERVAGWEEQ